jgi:hypothetical protein
MTWTGERSAPARPDETVEWLQDGKARCRLPVAYLIVAIAVA